MLKINFNCFLNILLFKFCSQQDNFISNLLINLHFLQLTNQLVYFLFNNSSQIKKIINIEGTS